MEIDQTELRSLAGRAISYWNRSCPAKYADLVERGELLNVALKSAERTVSEVTQLVSQGIPWTEAWELTREKYLFPPMEKQQTGGELALGEGESVLTTPLDEVKYAQVKPHFKEMWDDLVAAGKSAKECVQFAKQVLGAQGKPYFERFLSEEFSDEKRQSSTEPPDATGGRSLEEALPEPVQGAEGERGAGEPSAPSGGDDLRGSGGPGEQGNPMAGGVGTYPVEVSVPAGGGKPR